MIAQSSKSNLFSIPHVFQEQDYSSADNQSHSSAPTQIQTETTAVNGNTDITESAEAQTDIQLSSTTIVPTLPATFLLQYYVQADYSPELADTESEAYHNLSSLVIEGVRRCIFIIHIYSLLFIERL